MFYFNLFDSCILTALNICRYFQIARNQNIYKFHRRKLILISIIFPMLVLSNLIIQDMFGWCVVVEIWGESCTFTYTITIVRVWNLCIMLISPILISFYMLILALFYLKNTKAQKMIMRRIHPHIILHSFIFYSICLILWASLIIIIYLDIDTISKWLKFVASTVSKQ